MTRLTRVRTIGWLLALLGCAGCYESAFPIDAAPQADVEQALVGAWRCLSFDAKTTERPATLTIALGADRRYTVTFQEDGKPADSYDAYGSSIGGEVLFNVRDLSGGSKPWVFLRRTLVRPNLLTLQILSGDALPAQDSPAALRKTVEQLRGKPGAFEDGCACVRSRAEDAAAVGLSDDAEAARAGIR